eukprot:gnl/TRDRNA2_/TRDRNA2_199512_c0_seq1.p1 gnl/TRDRNA2_/TRDRNA2_199512_c0~~gnl/TRDRNA2_/TRDRNA2_199512_c0_seq1.p1  ORF type:complete len:283 (+),score=42.97 gnl/TRDRNA2_/TRDRNA2_199512_c0_seq1:36-884(+)
MAMAPTHLMLLVAAACCASLAGAFPVSARICGNYCGPGWCNGKMVAENECDDSVEPETSPIFGPSCADSCCRAHDKCCGHEDDKSHCNKNMIDCLSKCTPWDLSCTNGPVPAEPMALSSVMQLGKDLCCGDPCPGSKAAHAVKKVEETASEASDLAQKASKELHKKSREVNTTELVQKASGLVHTASEAVDLVEDAAASAVHNVRGDAKTVPAHATETTNSEEASRSDFSLAEWYSQEPPLLAAASLAWFVASFMLAIKASGYCRKGQEHADYVAMEHLPES